MRKTLWTQIKMLLIRVHNVAVVTAFLDHSLYCKMMFNFKGKVCHFFFRCPKGVKNFRNIMIVLNVHGLFFLPFFFSSAEHKVLRMSYCDLSVVRHPSVQITKKKKSSPKLTIRFQSNFTEMILRSCSFKIF